MDGVVAAEQAEAALLADARRGDGEAFRNLVAPHLRGLHVHCYRMLGSYHDAEEVLQEVLLRAWRALDSFEGRAPLRHWLIRITTTTCLKAIERKGRLPVVAGEVGFLEPYPDRLLDELTGGDPAMVAETRESVALAFIVALQRLPATQRATLVLREVLGWSAAEVADLLGCSVPAVNSSLQRARGTLGTITGTPRSLDRRDEQVLGRFVQAWQRCDIAALAALLHEDAVLRMPPEDAVIRGREQVAGFFAAIPADGAVTVTQANGHLALAAYLPGEDGGPCPAYGLVVFTFTADGIDSITGFPDPTLLRFFDLPVVHANGRGRS
ncbi:RNA polymerase subunit sigma-70 [Acrocarpospora macrocephala]|uniref:RNA polymerase subunit sigma-70 n=1 Tax=Acrocarpospora macrocephala TaxID=150177 RepID=UPI0014793376|nr:RNA polymerase subunit sigma-70 [Acrocarpospora macrocephala]